MNDLPYRPNVCLLITNEEKKFLLCERNGCPGIWQFPQGGIEIGMTAAETALKEAHEELGVKREDFIIIRQLIVHHEYEFAEPIPERYKGIFKGQKQTFIVLKYLGSDLDFQLDRYDQELMNWCWCSVAQVRELAEPKRLIGYEKAFKELGL